MGMRPVTIIGAATSAGTHHAGQERTPDALLAAGLIERLIRAGITVTDHGNVVRETFRVDPGDDGARNLAATVRGVAHLLGRAETECEPQVPTSGDRAQAILRAPGPGTGVTSRADSRTCPARQDRCSSTGSPQSRWRSTASGPSGPTAY
jgi:hypothetical protein